MSVFTKADIEIETFTESIGNGSIKKLYTYLEELRSQGIYVVDVTLVSTQTYESSYYGTKFYYECMIRVVRPKYEVTINVKRYNEDLGDYEFIRTEPSKFFKTLEEAEAEVNRLDLTSTDFEDYNTSIIHHKPLETEI